MAGNRWGTVIVGGERMALAKFFAFLLISYAAIALVSVVAVIVAVYGAICLWGLFEWAMLPFWESLSKALR
jgi:hypothetical protein